MSPDEWKALVERVDNLEKPCREVDDAIWWATVNDGEAYFETIDGARMVNVAAHIPSWNGADWRPCGPYSEAPALSLSVDAVLNFMAREFPDNAASISMSMARKGERLRAVWGEIRQDEPSIERFRNTAWSTHGAPVGAPMMFYWARALLSAFCRAMADKEGRKS